MFIVDHLIAEVAHFCCIMFDAENIEESIEFQDRR